MDQSGPPQDDQQTLAAMARAYAERAGIERKDNGHVDLLKASGGLRGIVESVLPGLVFLVLFTVTRSLNVALIAAIVAAAAFTIARLLQRQPLTQALAGIAGVVISALVSRTTGEAKDYYVSGFVIDVVSIVVLVASILSRWPVLGILFGYVRNEGLRWRREPERLRAYAVASWIMTAVMAARLAVQVPLYAADLVAALGTTRLLMGVPLYVLGLWLAWLVSRPAATTPSGASSETAEP